MMRLTNVIACVALFGTGCASEPRDGEDPQGMVSYGRRVDPATGRVIDANANDTRRVRSTMDGYPREDSVSRDADGTVTSAGISIRLSTP